MPFIVRRKIDHTWEYYAGFQDNDSLVVFHWNKERAKAEALSHRHHAEAIRDAFGAGIEIEVIPYLNWIDASKDSPTLVHQTALVKYSDVVVGFDGVFYGKFRFKEFRKAIQGSSYVLGQKFWQAENKEDEFTPKYWMPEDEFIARLNLMLDEL